MQAARVRRPDEAAAARRKKAFSVPWLRLVARLGSERRHRPRLYVRRRQSGRGNGDGSSSLEGQVIGIEEEGNDPGRVGVAGSATTARCRGSTSASLCSWTSRRQARGGPCAT